ncbi:MAG TPA: hypothetical protein VN688_20725 [Gemmataceae bacterium]|nr:hypothetical protein [Gemmataceae bacterium]
MSEHTNGKTRPDRWVYVKNRAKFLPTDLLPYADQWLAWSADGSQIVAHHKDLAEVARMVAESGLEREDVIFDHLPPGGEVTTLL